MAEPVVDVTVAEDPGDGRQWHARNWLIPLLLAASTGLSLALRALIPPDPIYNAAADDLLQVSLADQIERGEWLGPWNVLTLAKGPGYPMFLAGIHALGLAPTVAAQIVYLLGCALVTGGAWLWLGRSRAVLLLYPVLALNPAMLGAPISRVYREGLVAALAAAAIGLALLLTYLAAHRTRRRSVWLVLFATTSLALGLAIAWLAITRVDTVWVWIGLAIWGLLATVIQSSGVRESLIRLGLTGLAAAMAGLCVVSVHSAIAGANERAYGVDLVDDYAAGNFPGALNTWASVIAGPPREFVPISEAQRRAAYAVSPAARRLEPYLETPRNIGPDAISCVSASVCDDIAGGWTPWAIRDAAAQAGAADTAPEFQKFFSRVRIEIKAACDDGRLACGAKGLGPGMPPAGDIDRATVIDRLQEVVISGYLGESASDATRQGGGKTSPNMDTWRRSVNGLPDNTETRAAPTSIPTRSASALGRAYSVALILLCIPALVGLLVGLFRPGRTRSASAVGLAAVAGALTHSAILAIYSAGTGANPGHNFYLVPSHSWMLVAVWLGVLNLWWMRAGLVARHRVTPGARSGWDARNGSYHAKGKQDDARRVTCHEPALEDRLGNP